jgi:DNA damage-inducible protein 1
VIRDDTDAVATTEVSGEMTVADLKSVIGADLSLAAEQTALFYLGQELTDTQTISAANIEDNAMLTASRKRPQPAAATSPQAQQQRQQVRSGQGQGTAGRGGMDASGIEEMRQQALSQPLVRQQMRGTWPDLADAVEDPQRFADIFTRAWRERQAERERMEREMEFLDSNPTAENQAKILEHIRLQQVEENRQAAIENLPMGKQLLQHCIRG